MKIKHIIEIVLTFIIFGLLYKIIHKTSLYLLISKNHGILIFFIFLGLMLSAGFALLIQETAITIFKKIKSILSK